MKFTAHAVLLLIGVACVACAGCAKDASAPQPNATRGGGGSGGGRVIAMSQGMQSNDPNAPRDPAAPQQIIFQVDIYQLSVPLGTYSENEEFWKRVDEQCVRPMTYDVLRRNGIRVGQAPLSELEFFKKFMDVKPLMEKLSTTSPKAQNIELELKKELPEQDIWQYDFQGMLSGKSYDGSTNIINMSFEPTPRMPGCIRLSLCPVVRATKKHLEYTQLNNDTEIQYVNSQKLFDLNLQTDIPEGRFFIVTPSSPEGRLSTSVGHAFLTKDGHTEPLEQILLIIPTPVGVSPAR
jgi:hypothetical protein